MVSTSTSDRGEDVGGGGGCNLAELTGVLGSGGCAGGEGGRTSTGGWLRGATCKQLRGCSNDSDGAGNGVGVAAASDRGEGEGGCDLTELTSVGSMSCSKGGDGEGNGVGGEAANTSDGGGGEGVGSGRSGGCAGSESGWTRVREL